MKNRVRSFPTATSSKRMSNVEWPSKTFAILSFSSSVGFVAHGVFIILVSLYFIKFNDKDPPLFKCLVFSSFVIETTATGLLFSVIWVISFRPEFPITRLLAVFALRVACQLISQLYFGYRCWCLIGRQRWVGWCWIGLLFLELAAATFGIYLARNWSMQAPRALPHKWIFSGYAVITFFLNCHVASIFAYKLLQMKSPFRRSTKVLYRILIYSFFSNASIGAFAFWFAVAWHQRTDHWFQLPLELLGKAYPMVLVLALLARGDARNEMDSSRTMTMQLETELDFLDPTFLEQGRRRSSAEQVPETLMSPPEDVTRFLIYRPNAGRRREST